MSASSTRALPSHPLSLPFPGAVMMAYHGFADRILVVDLSSGTIEVQSHGGHFFRTFFGGRGLIAHELLTRTNSGVDPLGPDNVLVFAPGVLTGAPIGGAGRNSVGARSPLTGCYGDAEVGGFWGAELKRAGFDAVVVTGKADHPVYISVNNDRVEIRDGRKISGKPTREAQEIIRKDLNDHRVRVCQCGPAGERLVRYACVVNDLNHFAGRCGIGAVMGSKNLRAVAVRGSGRIEPKDPETFSSVRDWLKTHYGGLTAALRDQGTMSVLLPLHISGGLPTRNFREGVFESAEAIGGEAFRDELLSGTDTCYACPVCCKRVVEAKKPYPVDPDYGGPEYETAAALGSNCGVGDLHAIAKAGELCNAYGLDTISTGVTIAFAMECYEEGIIGDGDTDGLDLRFGNAEAMLALIGMIARREGIGDLLAEGVKRAAGELGSAAGELAMHVKGQEIPMHEPRLKHGLGLGYTLSPTGADHCHNIHDTLYARESRHLEEIRALGILGPLDIRDLGEDKVRLYLYESTFRNFLNCAVLCYFLPYSYNHIVDIVRGLTGWKTSLWELMKVGSRAVNLTRVYNVREGFDSEDDRLPARFFEPLSTGPLQGVSVDEKKLERAKQTYYRMMSWSVNRGVPSRGTLSELGIEWAHELMAGGVQRTRRQS